LEWSQAEGQVRNFTYRNKLIYLGFGTFSVS
jgi:hypothetical protein